MKKTKHTPEPWHQGIYDNPKRLALAIFDERHDEVAVADTVETARRIVACVNACREIDISVLEIPDYSVKTEIDTLDAQIAGRLKAEADAIKNADLYLAASRDVQKLTAQRDELLAALKSIDERFGFEWSDHPSEGCTDLAEMMKNAIQKAESHA